MHETIKLYVTVSFTLTEKLALKTPNNLIKNGVFIDFTFYGLLRYAKKSDKFALPTVIEKKNIFG
jgi:hypothetical protein